MEMKMNLGNKKAYQEAPLSKEHYRAGIPTRKEGGIKKTAPLRSGSIRRSSAGIGIVVGIGDFFQRGNQIIQRFQTYIAGQKLIFEIDGKFFKFRLKLRADVRHIYHLDYSLPVFWTIYSRCYITI